MTSARHLDESLSSLRAEIHALDIGRRRGQARLQGLVLDIDST